MYKPIETFITNEFLLNHGFTPKITSSKTYNVLCVTKRKSDNSRVDSHLPANDAKSVEPAEVKHALYARVDIEIVHTIVTFKGRDYDLKSFREGLSGSSLVIGIHNEDEEPYDVWELYTDTPSHRKDKKVTREELRKWAKLAIGWNKRIQK